MTRKPGTRTETRYVVTWQTDVWVDTHEDAAAEAWAMLTDPEALAPIFSIRTHEDEQEDREPVEIDCESLRI